MNFYNEFDPAAAAWLRELIAVGAIPPGVVDERSISDLQPSDLHGYTQCHFFAGIGGWSLALQLAEIDPSRPLWTGSCPCQPYSAAGKGLGDADPRNLWPAFFRLIRECRPELVFGEQVADAIGKGWLDRVSADLEGEGYACGAAVLGAHSVGAPHIRKRLYWVADATGEQSHRSWDSRRGRGESPDDSDAFRLADAESNGGREDMGAIPSGTVERIRSEKRQDERRPSEPTGWSVNSSSDPCRLADSLRPGLQGHAGNVTDGNQPGRLDTLAVGSVAAGGAVGGLGYPGRERDERRGGAGNLGCAAGEEQGQAQERERGGDAAGDSMPDDFWHDYYWLPCRDGKHRRVPTEPALFPLADGLPYKLARRGSIRPALLKGAGNAIVPQVASEFIAAYLETLTP